MHLDSDLLHGLGRHPILRHLDICPGSNQRWLPVLNDNTPLPFSFRAIEVRNLKSLALTMPNFLGEHYWGPENEESLLQISQGLTNLIKDTCVLESLSLRLGPIVLADNEGMMSRRRAAPSTE